MTVTVNLTDFAYFSDVISPNAITVTDSFLCTDSIGMKIFIGGVWQYPYVSKFTGHIVRRQDTVTHTSYTTGIPPSNGRQNSGEHT